MIRKTFLFMISHMSLRKPLPFVAGVFALKRGFNDEEQKKNESRTKVELKWNLSGIEQGTRQTV